MSSVEIRMSGPLFDGRAARAMQAAANDARDSIAEFAEEHVLALMGAAFRNPTGYYESNVSTSVVSADVAVVDDNGVVYGPWLEGVGSRNSPVTRFPGYAHWRRTKALVQARALPIAERAVARHLPEMG